MSLLTTAESELTTLALEWESHFPGNTKIQTTQRQDLTFAAWQLTQIRLSLLCFQTTIRSTGIPDNCWRLPDVKHFGLLQKQHTHAQKEFDRLLHNLEATTIKATATKATATKTTTAKPNKTEPIEPLPDPPPFTKITDYQIVEITVVDGAVVTSVEKDAAHFLTKNAWYLLEKVRRQMKFPGAVVPEIYAWALMHNGVTYPDAEYVTLDYSAEEFQRLCELEIQSGNTHLLDGERHGYYRREPLLPKTPTL